MGRTRHAIVIIVLLGLILLTAALGTLLGTVAPHEWDLLLTQIQSHRTHLIAPASSTQATLFVLDENKSAMREVRVNLHTCSQQRGCNLTSVPILLTERTGVVEMPLDSGLALRIELVTGISDPNNKMKPTPPVLPIQIAEH